MNAKQLGLPYHASKIEALESNGFYLSQSLKTEALILVDES
ncbi:hypothetical protein [Okeania sp. SIO2C9]|nr:hypothetical protein [Okeania sp. SIO2C9]